ncbi:hypothetical protein D4R75_13285 [bacterium]|nr:MAG: hypothetical protein D4R75_13285 [bacterium]
MPTPLFEFFEVVAEELSAAQLKVITHGDLQTNEADSPLLAALMKELKTLSMEDTVRGAVKKLESHFKAKGAKLPFEYLPDMGRFTAVDSEFLSFVNEMRGIRTIGKRSRDFECRVAHRIGIRTTGSIHRVGHPRDRKKKKVEFNKYLNTLGFSRPVLLGMEKDGGFDILWLLPLGTVPHRPIVSVQCKNGEFNMDAADTSVGAASRSFSQHGGLQPGVHVPCVLFNDYIRSEILTRKQLNFVPLGLSDLAAIAPPISVKLI